MNDKENLEIIEKAKEIKYVRLNFQNKLRVLASKQNEIIKEMIRKSDSRNLKKVREEIE